MGDLFIEWDKLFENEFDFGNILSMNTSQNHPKPKNNISTKEITTPHTDKVRVYIGNVGENLDKLVNRLNNMANWETHSWNNGKSIDTWSDNIVRWESQNWRGFYGLGVNNRKKQIDNKRQITFNYSISYFVYHTPDERENSFRVVFNNFVSDFNKAIAKHSGWSSAIDTENAEYDDKKKIITVKDSLVITYDRLETNRESIIKNVKDFFANLSKNLSIFGAPNWTNWLKVNDNGTWKEIYTLSNKVYDISIHTSVEIQYLWMIAFSEWLQQREFAKYVKCYAKNGCDGFNFTIEVIKPFIDEDDIAYIFFNSHIGKYIESVSVGEVNSDANTLYTEAPNTIYCKEYFDDKKIDFITTEAPVAQHKPKRVIDNTKKRYRKCVYEIVKEIDEIDGIPVKAYIVKKFRGKLDGKRYTLNQHDCELLGIEYRNNLEILPYDMEFGDVYKVIKD